MSNANDFTDFAKRRVAMRRSPTTAEALLWGQLRDRRIAGRKFRRQHQIGPYIVDFFRQYGSLVVEVDGSQHLEAAGISSDARRTKFLESQGLTVLRFTNAEVATAMDAVLEKIIETLEMPPSP